jgi:hypothetical protein
MSTQEATTTLPPFFLLACPFLQSGRANGTYIFYFPIDILLFRTLANTSGGSPSPFLSPCPPPLRALPLASVFEARERELQSCLFRFLPEKGTHWQGTCHFIPPAPVDIPMTTPPETRGKDCDDDPGPSRRNEDQPRTSTRRRNRLRPLTRPWARGEDIRRRRLAGTRPSKSQDDDDNVVVVTRGAMTTATWGTTTTTMRGRDDDSHARHDDDSTRGKTTTASRGTTTTAMRGKTMTTT